MQNIFLTEIPAKNLKAPGQIIAQEIKDDHPAGSKECFMRELT